MPGVNSQFDKALGKYLAGQYQARDQKQEDFLEVLDLSLSAMQRKIRGDSAFYMSEFLALCAAMTPPIPPVEALGDAIKLYEALSAVPSTKDELLERRETKERPTKVDWDQERHVAITDERLDQDEPSPS